MRIAILGTRGIPNFHGGFEQFAEYLSEFLSGQGHVVAVYNSHTHPYKERMWRGVQIIHKKDPENKIGTAGQFIYDLNCILDSRRRNFDVILQLGYTSSSVWSWLLPRNPLIITNMDGLEWKRSKYSSAVRKFLKYAEKLAVRTSDYLIADSIGIQKYLQSEYKVSSTYIAYGAKLFIKPSQKILEIYGVAPYKYNMLIARLEPENNIETILDGVQLQNGMEDFLVIGKHKTPYGRYLVEKYKQTTNIRFLGGIYDLDHLNNLRYYSGLYFHGHSVGGTNPSLLEAMASSALIVANDNIFNRSILGSDAFYFKTSNDVARCFKIKKTRYKTFLDNNIEKIKNEYEWNIINWKYEAFMLKCLEDH